MTGFLCVPFVGHVFNGMSYVTNRWAFAYTMLVAYIVVKMYPVFLNLCARQKKILIVLTILEILACLAGIAGKYLVGEKTKIGVMAVLLLMLIIFVFEICRRDNHKKTGKAFRIFLICVNICCVLINALDVRTREADANRFVAQGSAQKRLENIPTSELTKFLGTDNSCLLYTSNCKWCIGNKGCHKFRLYKNWIDRHRSSYISWADRIYSKKQENSKN